MTISELSILGGSTTTVVGGSSGVIGDPIDLTGDAGPTVAIDLGELDADVTSQTYVLADTVTAVEVTPPPVVEGGRERLALAWIGGSTSGCEISLDSGAVLSNSANSYAARVLQVSDPGAGFGGAFWGPADFFDFTTSQISDFTSEVNNLAGALVSFGIGIHSASADPHGDRAYTDTKAGDRTVVTGSSGQRKIVAGNPTNAIASSINVGVITGGGQTNYENVIGAASTANVGTASSNLPTVGSGAVGHYSTILGGYDNVANALMSMIAGAHCLTEAAADHSTISGGSFHRINAGSYGTIGGGTANLVSNTAATVSGGTTNTASGIQATVAGGSTNTASGQGSAIAGGLSNTASGTYTLAAGRSNTASSPYTVATGYYARGYTEGMRAHASGRFAALGDAQASSLVLRNTTTDASATILGPAGAAAHHQMQEPASCFFRAIIVAREPSTGDSKTWKLEGLATNNTSASVVNVGGAAPTVVQASAGAAAWTCAVATGSNSLGLTGTGEVGKTIRWVALFEMVEVGG